MLRLACGHVDVDVEIRHGYEGIVGQAPLALKKKAEAMCAEEGIS